MLMWKIPLMLQSQPYRKHVLDFDLHPLTELNKMLYMYTADSRNAGVRLEKVSARRQRQWANQLGF